MTWETKSNEKGDSNTSLTPALTLQLAMRALSCWLVLVGLLRLSAVWFGFFDIWALRKAVFSRSPMTEVHGRTFGTWTLLTCTLCFACAANLDNRELYWVTFASFVYALAHFLTEYCIYGTMALANLATVSIFAGGSIVWMLLESQSLSRRKAA